MLEVLEINLKMNQQIEDYKLLLKMIEKKE